MNSEVIEPIGGKHAIEVMAIGIEWAAPMGESEMKELEATYTTSSYLQEFLPSLTPLHELALNIGIPGNFVAENRAGGFDLKQFKSNGNVAWAVSIRPGFIACNCMDYDRWASIKPTAIELLTPFLKAAIAKGQQIQAVGLQYQDVFRVNCAIGSESLATLFRQNSAFIPGHLLKQHSLWHSHQGWFSESPEQQRLLNNVNLDVLEQDSHLLVKLNGQHRVFSLSGDGKVSRVIDGEQLEEILDFLHIQNKKVLGEVLSDEILDRIGLKVDK